MRPWADPLQTTLNTVRPTDLTNDRLADMRARLSDDVCWAACAGALTQHILRVYDLTPTTVRVDGATASGYWAVTDAGMFQFGPCKDQRLDRPQLKFMLATRGECRSPWRCSPGSVAMIRCLARLWLGCAPVWTALACSPSATARWAPRRGRHLDPISHPAAAGRPVVADDSSPSIHTEAWETAVELTATKVWPEKAVQFTCTACGYRVLARYNTAIVVWLCRDLYRFL
ncbi:MAG: hypothetical protein MI924_27095 [Chloroflexales bacterium]|nr:hypothetical protein [Chloroflexales bacterium]